MKMKNQQIVAIFVTVYLSTGIWAKIVDPPRNTVAFLKGPMTVSCTTDDATYNELTWSTAFPNGSPLYGFGFCPSNANGRNMTGYGNTCHLHIDAVRLSDAGQYRCTIYFAKYNESKTASAAVAIIESMAVHDSTTQGNVIMGSNTTVKFEIKFDGYMTPSLNFVVPPGVKLYQVAKTISENYISAELTITSDTPNSYVIGCGVTFDPDPLITAIDLDRNPVVIENLLNATVHFVERDMFSPPKNTVLFVNSPLILSCTSNASPNKEISWQKFSANEGSVWGPYYCPNSGRNLIGFGNTCQYYVPVVNPTHAGEYRCQSLNTKEKSSSAAVAVIESVYVQDESPFSPVHTNGDATIMFEMSFAGDMKPSLEFILPTELRVVKSVNNSCQGRISTKLTLTSDTPGAYTVVCGVRFRPGPDITLSDLDRNDVVIEYLLNATINFVAGDPAIIFPPRNTVVYANGPLFLSCTKDITNNYDLKWEKQFANDTQQVGLGLCPLNADRYYSTSNGRSCQLYYPQVTAADAGLYRCLSQINAEMTASAAVVVIESADVHDTVTSGNATVGSNVTIKFQVKFTGDMIPSLDFNIPTGLTVHHYIKTLTNGYTSGEFILTSDIPNAYVIECGITFHPGANIKLPDVDRKEVIIEKLLTSTTRFV